MAGAGAAGLVLAGLWLARVPLTEAAVQAWLRARGVDGAVELQKLGMNAVRIGSLRLGPAGAPTLAVTGLEARFALDLARGQVRIEQLAAQDFQVRLALGADGSLDLGALAPLLEGPAGPRRVRLEGLDIPRVRVRLDTPHGPLTARLATAGGETAGIRTRGFAVAPRGLTGGRPGRPFAVETVLRLPQGGGLALSAGLAGPQELLEWRGARATGLDGIVAAHLAVSPQGQVSALVPRADLRAGTLVAGGFEAGGAQITGRGLTWSGGATPRTVGRLAVRRIEARADRITGPQTGIRAVSLVLAGQLRGSDGRGQVQVEAATGPVRLAGVQASALRVSGASALLLPDLGLPGGWSASGPLVLEATALSLPPVPALPGPGATQVPKTLALRIPVEVSASADLLTLSPAGALEARAPGAALTAQLRSPAGRPALRLPLANPRSLSLDLAGSITGTLDGAAVDTGPFSAALADGTWRLAAQEARLDGLRLAGTTVSSDSIRLGASGTLDGGLSGADFAARLTLAPAAGAPLRVAGGSGTVEARLSAASQLDWQASGAAGSLVRTLPGAGGFAARGLAVTGQGTADLRSGRGRVQLRALAHQLGSPGLSAFGLDVGLAGPLWWQAGQARQLAAQGSLSIRAAEVRSGAGTRATALGLDGRWALLLADGRAPALSFDADGAARQVDQGPARISQARAVASGQLELAPSGPSGPVTAQLSAQDLTSGDTRLAGLTGRARLAVAAGQKGTVTIAATDRCAPLRIATAELGAGRSSRLAATLCNGPGGQLARVGPRGLDVLGRLAVEPLTVTYAAPSGPPPAPGAAAAGPAPATTVALGRFEGTFSGSGIALSADTRDLMLSIPLGTGQTAVIRSGQASVQIAQQAGGVSITGQLDALSATGLPVALAGSATASLLARAEGLTGAFGFDDLAVEDAAEADLFGALRLSGTGTLRPGAVELATVVREARTGAEVAHTRLVHDLATGAGQLEADIQGASGAGLAFNPRWRGQPLVQGLQPADLIPPLRGIVAGASGSVLGSALVAWQPGEPLRTEATVLGTGLSFATGAGPVSAVGATISLTDLINPTTDGPQSVRVGRFIPGIPLDSGDVRFELKGDGRLHLLAASWPFAGGTLALDPAEIPFGARELSFTLRASRIDLKQFLDLTEVPNLVIEGTASGVIPVVVRDGVAEIVGGRLMVDGQGGTIRYTGPDVASPPPPPRSWRQRLQDRATGGPGPQGADLAIQALRNFRYRVLELSVNGRLTGDLTVGVVLEGANPDVLSGAPFRFNIAAIGPFMQLVQSIGRITDPQGYVDLVEPQLREQLGTQVPVEVPEPSPEPSPAPSPAP